MKSNIQPDPFNFEEELKVAEAEALIVLEDLDVEINMAIDTDNDAGEDAEAGPETVPIDPEEQVVIGVEPEILDYPDVGAVLHNLNEI